MNNDKLPIKVTVADVCNNIINEANKSVTLSSLIYNFKNIKKIKVEKAADGIIRLEDTTDNNSHRINFSSAGEFNLSNICVFLNSSFNSYVLQKSDINDSNENNHKYYDAEVMIHCSNESYNLLLFIPVKKSGNSGSSDSNFFDQIPEQIDIEEGQKNININRIIPSGPFWYYVIEEYMIQELNGIVDLDGKPSRVIFFHETIEINENILRDLSGNTSSIFGSFSQSRVPPRELTKNNLFYNNGGARNSEEVYDDGLVPMECEPIEDLSGDLIDGNRFDWIKRTTDKMNKNTKNYLYVIILVLVLTFILYFAWKTIFTTIGGLNGPEFIARRVT